jgi:hypothetical protein
MLNTRLGLTLASELTQAFDLASGSVPLSLARQYNWPSGTAADQADTIFHDQRTIAASGSDDLDLAGVLTNPFGATITFADVRLILVAASAANTNNVIVGGDANALLFGGAAAHTVTVRPGGLFLLAARDATAYAVTAGTGDILQIANSGAGTSVTYDVVIIGASA